MANATLIQLGGTNSDGKLIAEYSVDLFCNQEGATLVCLVEISCTLDFFEGERMPQKSPEITVFGVPIKLAYASSQGCAPRCIYKYAPTKITVVLPDESWASYLSGIDVVINALAGAIGVELHRL